MKPRQQVSRAAVELIKKFEGYRRRSARLIDGRWTLGYGHVRTAREGAEVSEQDAEALLLYDLIAVAHAVNEWCYAPLTQNQFDALCAFAFNIGVENFRQSSVLLRINEGQLLQAACAMELWRKAEFEGERIVIDALVRRRAAEKALFLTPTDGWTPAPTPILRPSVDTDAAGAVPRETPTVLRTSLEGTMARAERVEALSPIATPMAAEMVRAPVLTREEPAPREVPPMPPRQEFAPLPPEPAFVQLEPAFDLTPELQHPLPAHDAAEFGPMEVEPEPSLFDPRSRYGEDPLAQPAPPSPEPRRILIDDTLEYDGPLSFPAAQAPGMSFLPFLGLGLLGLIFFAGGLFWSVTVKQTASGAPSMAAVVGWVACLVGVGFFAVAAYLALGRLGRGPVQSGGFQDYDTP